VRVTLSAFTGLRLASALQEVVFILTLPACGATMVAQRGAGSACLGPPMLTLPALSSTTPHYLRSLSKILHRPSEAWPSLRICRTSRLRHLRSLETRDAAAMACSL